MVEKISVLLVDDDETFRRLLDRELSFMGYKITSVPGGEEALRAIAEENFDVTLLDIVMPGIGGIEVLKSIKEARPMTEVIMLTGHATIDSAINSMKLGAYDYLSKPCQLDELQAVIQKAYEKKSLVQQNVLLKQELARKERFQEFVGCSPGLKAVLEMIAKVAAADSTVLIRGESGAGKELVARAVHKNSPRRDHPFVVVDCGSLHETLLQSELFGHEKGAFTGAVALKHGLFEVADKGTLFLDEIGDVSPAIQFKLLRVLETGTFRRVGGIKDIKVDVRVLASTNKDLQKLVSEGLFREDLFYRLNVITIPIPPLRERREDISLLAKNFTEHTTVTGKERKEITPEAMELLVNYHWPGNVRELQNVIERAIILSEDKYIKPEDLPTNLKRGMDFYERVDQGPYMSLKELEKRYISTLLKEFGGHRGKVAQVLKISERNLYRMIKRYNIGD